MPFSKRSESIIVIGGGLAGCEAAWQLLTRGIPVTLYEMKPVSYSAAHTSPLMAELVCSNSLRSNVRENAVGLLKEEMRLLGSLIIAAADHTSVPAGSALAVDRDLFSRHIEAKLSGFQDLNIIRQEVAELPDDRIVIVATGPLTADGLSKEIGKLTGKENLFFYDAISPIVDDESIDRSKTFFASRYDPNSDDYLNCPLSRAEYETFYRELLSGKEVAPKDFEDKKCFEGCLPIEVLARRGADTLRYGPMKPVGLTDPRTGKQFHAVVQLRRENRESSLYNIVGFQTKLTWPEQRRIFRLIPGLEQAEFARYGSIHRNTFINSPALLRDTLQLTCRDGLFFAGQITGVEGYVESAAMGLLAGINAARYRAGLKPSVPGRTTALGALIHHVTGGGDSKNFQPMNINFGLFAPLERKYPRKERGRQYAQRSLSDLEQWKERIE
ncbi:MAG: methylenetetrahydrofolate--tRNA-(uracil(54)-C(5))-methyltransferase (FADH(2)-oxidizing) TrmFO [Deltaproteobacteria bacterium]|nr:methylenetetrahydrofolate--tRNA-(uracil(54)-C(5))-methyltransferase (FADH(2)-oxidizing) TrmFO [Deltaproteobacteria bacterium]